MIDFEDEIYNYMKKFINQKFEGVRVTNEYVNMPSEFPTVSIEEKNRSTLKSKVTANGESDFNEVMYEVHIYSNKVKGKKHECKMIANELDKMMHKLNFMKESSVPMPLFNNSRYQNLRDPSIYHIVLRYIAVTNGNTIYRR